MYKYIVIYLCEYVRIGGNIMYKFTKDCMTGIESIDKEHEQLFKIINEAQALLEEQAVDVKTAKCSAA